MTQRKSKKLAGAISLLIIAGAIGLVVSSSFSAGQYYRTVGEAKADPDKLLGEKFRVAGKVVKGTVVVAPGAAPDYTFQVHDEAGETIQVHYAKAVPDTFKEGVEVVVDGQLAAPGRFEATNVIAKCPSKYEGNLTPEEVAKREAKARGEVASQERGPGAGY